jgi:predicted PurR-regulated permease PerM
LWEHVLGFVGLFLSFPFLFVSKRIIADLRAESGSLIPDETAVLASSLRTEPTPPNS